MCDFIVLIGSIIFLDLYFSPSVLIVVDAKVVVDLFEEQNLSPETQPVFCLNISNRKHFLFFNFRWSLKHCYHMLYLLIKLEILP